MKLSQLSKPQWDAALNAARVLRRCDPNSAFDRADFRAARESLVALLPAGTDDRSVVSQAVNWDSLNDFAAAFAGLPAEVVA